jgi:RNA polymerase sigma factor (sigma-70 family)
MKSDDASSAASPPHADPRRFEELIVSLRPDAMLAVISSAMSRSLREHCSPEDVWQETLAHAWRDRAQHHWTNARAFRAWLFQIARNRIRETARHALAQERATGRAVVRRVDTSSTGSSVLPSGPTDSVTPSRIAARSERGAALECALSQLPPDVRDIMRLHVIEELPMNVVAERLGLSESSAWRRYHKGSEACARIVPSASGGEW